MPLFKKHLVQYVDENYADVKAFSKIDTTVPDKTVLQMVAAAEEAD